MNIYENSLKKSKKSNFSFIQLPDFLFTEPHYQALSNDAKILYSFLLRRHGLSTKNYNENGSWCDKSGVFILFPRLEMANLLHCSENKVRRLLSELRNVHLIREKRQGINKPNLIYINDLNDTVSTNSTVLDPSISTDPNPPIQRVSKKENYYNNTDLSLASNINQNNDTNQDFDLNTSLLFKKIDTANDINKHKNSINASSVEKNSDWHKKISQLLAFIQQTKIPAFHINGRRCSIQSIRMQFKRINQECISYVLESVSAVKTLIRNPRAYLLAALYNAPDTIDVYKPKLERITVFNNIQNKSSSVSSIHHKTERSIRCGDLAYMMDTLDD